MAKYEYDKKAKCLHCQTVVRFIQVRRGYNHARYASDEKENLDLYVTVCPECDRLIITIEEMLVLPGRGDAPKSEYVVWPLSSGRPPAPSEVPENIASDFNEASLVLPFSAKASAALSRRCLQTVIVEAGGADKENNLYNQIEEVLKNLPSLIAENLHYFREIGNFAAHEQKSIHTGLILDVEPGEAEWTLDVLESLFDFYYVTPEKERRRREAFDKKITDAGRKELKSPEKSDA